MSFLVPPVSPIAVDPRDVVRRKLGVAASSSKLVSKGKQDLAALWQTIDTYGLRLEDGRQVLLKLPNSSSLAPLVQSEAATLAFVATRTSIPVPKVLSHGVNDEEQPMRDAHLIIEKPQGVPADTIFDTLSPPEQDTFVAQLARWMLELYSHHFPAIGSLVDFSSDASSSTVGPIVREPFFADGRSQFTLDRGPYASAKAYYLACAQRELDCARHLFVQSASPAYQRELEDARFQVERCVGLMSDLAGRCDGLDEDDAELAPFSLDMHALGLKDVLVSAEDHSKIVSIIDWEFVNTRPLWCCARTPSWLQPYLSSGDSSQGARKSRLATIFRAEVARIAGLDSPFLRALNSDDSARCTLDDLADYDAFKDGFLLLPALENILATLPGQEDVAGLTALLDPSTLEGRVARINLATRGSNAMYLAMTPPRHVTHLPSQAGDDEGVTMQAPRGRNMLAKNLATSGGASAPTSVPRVAPL